MGRQLPIRTRRLSVRNRLQFEALEERRVMALAIAENLLVSLDARDASATTAVWDNTGSLPGDFTRFGNPLNSTFGDNANPAVFLNPTGANTDYYRGPVSTAGITGNGTRSIEVWAWNPALERTEETMVAWGRRGGGDGTNMAFNYSANATFGAVGHWAAPDVGWNGTPAAGQWHHLVYTYDGASIRVYADGVLRNTENHALNTHAGYDILLGVQNANVAAPGAPELGGTMGTLALGNVRIHEGVLSAAQVANNYNEDATRFGKSLLVEAAPAPVHRYSFNGSTVDSMGNAGNATLFGGAIMAGGELILNNAVSSDNPAAQYATLPIGSTIGASNQLTVEGWFTINGPATWQRVIDFGHDQNRYILFSPTSDNGGPAVAAIKNVPVGEQRATAPFTIPANQETHFAIVVDTAGDNHRLYINGELVAIDPNIAPFSPTAMGNTPLNYLGRSFFGGDQALRGKIEEIRIYREALNSRQVRGNFVSGPDLLNVAPVANNDAYSVDEGSTIAVPQFGNSLAAYAVPAGTIGNQGNFGGSLGMDFNVFSPITVTHLGVFDSGSDGITTTITARLYDRNNPVTPVAEIVFTPGDQGVLDGGNRIKPLAVPLTLPGGFVGRMVAYGFNAANPNGNSGGATPVWTTNGGDGEIAFLSPGFYGNAGEYPATADGGPINRYAAGTFKFQTTGTGERPTLLANDTDANGQTLRILQSQTIVSTDFAFNTTPANISINRNGPGAGLVQNDRLELTQAVNSQQSTAIISKPNPTLLLPGFSATFDLLIGNGTNPPADGVAFVYGSIPDNALFGENYGGSGLQVQFQTYNGGGQPTSFKLVYNGALLAQIPTDFATITPGAFRPVSINVTPGGLVTLTHNQQTIYQVQVPSWQPQADWRFAIGARTGGLNQQAYVDNLNIKGVFPNPVSALGVPVTLTEDGQFTYDPNSLSAVNPLATGETLADSFVYTVTDGILVSNATANITIVGTNDPVASANAGGPYTINELQNLVLSGSGVDPDTNDVLTYAWDLDSDGLFDDASGANPTVNWATLTGLTPPVNDQGVRQIRLRVSDAANTFQIATANLTINNIAPTVSASAPAQAVPNQSVDFELTAVDAPADILAGFTYAIDWDDSNPIETIAPTASNTPLSVPHAFSTPGTYNVTIAAMDKDGATSAVFTQQIVVVQAYEEGDVLYIGGTDDSERIIVNAGTSGGMQVRINNRIIGTFANSSSLVITAGGGNDNISVASKVNANATIDGGEGNDYIAGGMLADTLIGGPGNDRIFGGGGDDILFGGDNNDSISGGAGHDTIDGEAGNDTLNGDAGNDTVLGGEGNDRVSGGAGSDLLRGGEGTDVLDGGSGNDALAGDDQGDKLFGRAGNDVLVGGELMDVLYGGTGEDLLLGDDLLDNSDDALFMLLSAWNTTPGDATQRAAALLPTLDVSEDDDGDSLYGEAGADWLLLFLNDRTTKSDRVAPNVITE